MTNKRMILLPAALAAMLPFVALAETMSPDEQKLLDSAKLTLQQAADAALKAQQGKLAEVSFHDESKRAAFEAVVIAADGQSWTVMIDANTGEIFDKALTSDMKDKHDGEDDDA
ncbi:MAG: PepSY domain-containing protein [Defluviimonas sp.]|uniref:PepSY domain-containing protein n=1 Tax=Albidovulum sp. TaxID=1872424 RepID=UPI002A2D3E0A|nr:PepSY domain-containing protein [Defluviimonas sp.]